MALLGYHPLNPILPAQDGNRARNFYRDVQELTEELAARGTEFDPLGAGSFAGVEGVNRGRVMDFGAVKSSWFQDSEGNMLALNEIVTA